MQTSTNSDSHVSATPARAHTRAEQPDNSMKAVAARGLFRTKFRLEETTRPAVRPDEVLVNVHATSVNPKDWKLNTLISALLPTFGRPGPFLMGDDLSGEVVACGAEVTRFKVGDEVYGMDMRLRTATAAEYACISEQSVAMKPKNLSHEAAGVVPLAGLTAYQSLRRGEVALGSRVLVIGASGGVGTFAVQMGKAMGATVCGVSSGRNTELVRSLGADETVDYTQGDYRGRLGKFDVVFDATSYETPWSCRALMTRQSRFVSTMGQLSKLWGVAAAKLNPWAPRASAVLVKSSADDLDAIRTLIENGDVTPIIDSTFALADIGAAFERSKTGRSRGKLAITVP